MADELDDDLPGDKATPLETPPAKNKPTAKPNVAPDEPEPAAKKHVHTQRLIGIAKQMGFSQADLDDHPSDVIWAEIDQLHRHALERAKTQTAPAAVATPAKVEVDPDDEYLDAIEKDAELDPRFAKLLRGLKAATKAKPKDLEEARAKLDALEKKEQVREATRANDMMDAAFAALGKKYEHLVGAESMVELTDPGQRGWRGAIYQAAKIDFAVDSHRTITRKVAAAAAELCAGKIAEDEDDTVSPANAYDAVKPPKNTPAKDPTTGRFTTEQFARGKVARPSGAKVPVEVNGVEVLRQHFKENGDPRGSRSSVDPDDDSDLPG